MDLDLTRRGVNKGVWGKLGDSLFFLQHVLFYGSRHQSWKSSLPKIWTGNASMPRGLYALSLESESRRNVATLSRTTSDAYDTRRPTHVRRKIRTIDGRVRRVNPCYQTQPIMWLVFLSRDGTCGVLALPVPSGAALSRLSATVCYPAIPP
ncbi:hypothetical protein IG631_22086 [Alternaria alternata]|nr:hypothetical protein IG631_22086 [Alternaria alternata]